jgi:hypothetical protein
MSSTISFNNSTITFAYNVANTVGQAIYNNDGSRIYFNNSKTIFAPNGDGTKSMIYAAFTTKTVYFNHGSLVFTSHTTTKIYLINSTAAVVFNPDTIGFEYNSGAIITDFFFSSFS